MNMYIMEDSKGFPLENGFLPRILAENPMYKMFFDRVKPDLKKALAQRLPSIQILLRPSDFSINPQELAEWLFKVRLTDEWEENGEPCIFWQALISGWRKRKNDGDNILISIQQDSIKAMLGYPVREIPQ